MNTRLFLHAAELADDDRHDPRADDETPEPCRGCGSIHCDSECAEYRQWLAVAYLGWDAAQAAECQAAEDAADPFEPGPPPLDDGACKECGYLLCDGGCVLTDAQKNALLDAAHGGDADARP